MDLFSGKKFDLFTPLDKQIKQNLAISFPIIYLSYGQEKWLKFKSNKLALWGLGLFVLLLLMALIGPLIAIHAYDEAQLAFKNLPPSAEFWFGTDELGRDLFARCCWGARISLLVGVSASLIDLVIGVTYGLIAGWAGIGTQTDEWMMRFTDVLQSIPYVLIVILLIVLMGPGVKTIILALSVTGWINMARIMRSQVLQLKQQEFIKAAQAFGASNSRILRLYVMPNAIGPLLATLAATIPLAIFTESFLSFLGLGIQSPIASWGTLANDGLVALRYYPWRLFFPAILLSLTILSLNLIGEGLRTTFDAREDI